MSLFITLEGPEGGGKTTQVELLAEWLRQAGQPVYCTREPGGTPISDQIRRVLLDVENTAMTAPAEILLYSASRAQLVNEAIRPRLKRGDIVLCDRYADSTYAYQGYGRQLDLETLRLITRFATGGLTPDLTVCLDVKPETGLQRKAQQGEWNRLDQLDLAFHRRVRQGFLKMAAAEPERWLVLDASQPVAVVQQAIRARVGPLIA